MIIKLESLSNNLVGTSNDILEIVNPYYFIQGVINIDDKIAEILEDNYFFHGIYIPKFRTYPIEKFDPIVSRKKGDQKRSNIEFKHLLLNNNFYFYARLVGTSNYSLVKKLNNKMIRMGKRNNIFKLLVVNKCESPHPNIIIFNEMKSTNNNINYPFHTCSKMKFRIREMQHRKQENLGNPFNQPAESGFYQCIDYKSKLNEQYHEVASLFYLPPKVFEELPYLPILIVYHMGRHIQTNIDNFNYNDLLDFIIVNKVKYYKNKISLKKICDCLNKCNKELLEEYLNILRKADEIASKNAEYNIKLRTFYGHTNAVLKEIDNICKDKYLTSEEIELLKNAAIMHDFGKVTINFQCILRKRWNKMEIEEEMGVYQEDSKRGVNTDFNYGVLAKS